MEEVAKDLEARWKVQHKLDAEASFAAADDGVVRKSTPSFFQKADKVPETVLAAKKMK
jgi:hypothetical protein